MSHHLSKEHLSQRRKRGLSQSKAREIEHDKGFKRLGDGFDSPKQERFVRFVAGGKRQPKGGRRG